MTSQFGVDRLFANFLIGVKIEHMARGKTVPDSTGQIMTAGEVAELLHVHKSTLYRLIKKGNFPHFRVGIDYRFTRTAIDEWRRAQEVQRTTAGYHGPKPHKASRA